VHTLSRPRFVLIELEGQKADVLVLVVDHVDHPSPN